MAAAQYVRFKSAELGLNQNWYEDLDVAVLATYMGVPMEGLFLTMMTLPALLLSILPTHLVFCQTANQHAAHCYSHPSHLLFPKKEPCNNYPHGVFHQVNGRHPVPHESLLRMSPSHSTFSTALSCPASFCLSCTALVGTAPS